MVFFQSMFSAFLFLEQRNDDDFADRLSYFYTSTILMLMAILVSFKQFGGRPIECWAPAHFSETWEAYTEQYCWAQNTYWVPFFDPIPEDQIDRKRFEISYYQWVPFFLLICAFMFYFPCLLWRTLNGLSGIRLHDIISAFREKENIDTEIRARTVVCVAQHIVQALKFQQSYQSRSSYSMHRVLKCLNIRYYEGYVTCLYLIFKLLYTLNVLGNLVLMNWFLQTNDGGVYGVNVVKDLLRGHGWQQSGHFPRITLCDFDVRVLGQVQTYTVQCVLVINIFIEKIFILLWLWFGLLAIISVIDFLYWLGVSVKPSDRLHFMLRNLHLQDSVSGCTVHPDESKVSEFVKYFIKVDGVFVLRMVSVHVGCMYCSELVNELWNIFVSNNEPSDSEDNSTVSQRNSRIGSQELLHPTSIYIHPPSSFTLPSRRTSDIANKLGNLGSHGSRLSANMV